MGSERGKGLILLLRILNMSLNISGHPNGRWYLWHLPGQQNAQQGRTWLRLAAEAFIPGQPWDGHWTSLSQDSHFQTDKTPTSRKRVMIRDNVQCLTHSRPSIWHMTFAIIAFVLSVVFLSIGLSSGWVRAQMEGTQPFNNVNPKDL